MKYHGFILKKIYDNEVDGGFYYEIFDKEGHKINIAWCLDSAKDYIDSGLNPIYL